MAATGGRQFAEEKILEDAAGALHGGRKFFVAHLENAGRGLFECGGGGGVEGEFDLENDPVFAALEDALAIAEIALRVVENAHGGAIEEAHGGDAFGDGMAVGAGVAVDRGADPAGDAGERFEALEGVTVGEIDQVLKHGAGAGGDARAIGVERVGGVAQHEAAEALVGNDQVGAAADDTDGRTAFAGGGKGRDECLLVAGLGKEIGGSADTEPGIAGERSAGGNG